MTFKQLLRERFAGKDATVPWHLDDKFNSYVFVEKLGVRTPKLIGKLEHIEEISSFQLPSCFVLKISNAHSGIGIMLLEKMNDGIYFEHLSLEQYTMEQVIKKQSEISKKRGLSNTYWIIEELLDNFMIDKKIPFDYKVYCFNGWPKVVIQIDRNSSTPTVAVFDGSFMPLEYGTDYQFDLNRWKPAQHLIPPHAPDLLKAAQKLAKATGDKFVSVDLYDTTNGVFFGEFTFAPGAPDVGMIRFSEEILTHLDESLYRIDHKDYNWRKGFKIDNESLYKQMLKIEKTGFTSEYYSKLLIRAYCQDYKAVQKLALNIDNLPKSSETDRINQHFSLAWKVISNSLSGDMLYSVMVNIKRMSGFIDSSGQQIAELYPKAKEYLSLKRKASWWHDIRYAQFIMEFSEKEEERETALATLEKYADEGKAFASNVLKQLNLMSTIH